MIICRSGFVFKLIGLVLLFAYRCLLLHLLYRSTSPNSSTVCYKYPYSAVNLERPMILYCAGNLVGSTYMHISSTLYSESVEFISQSVAPSLRFLFHLLLGHYFYFLPVQFCMYFFLFHVYIYARCSANVTLHCFPEW